MTSPSSQTADRIVDLAGVKFAWRGGQGFGISVDALQLPAGSKTLLLGPSGAGKSTLLNLLCGIVSPDAGKISLLGQDIAALGDADRDRFRAEHIGVIFQMFNLLPYGTAVDNVVLPLSFAPKRCNRAGAGTAERTAEAHRLLSDLEIGAEQLAGPAAELSVGQQQRVAAARALIGAPEIIIADEPTSALDKSRESKFLELLFNQIMSVGSTLIMVSHDSTLGSHFDQVLRLEDLVRSHGAQG